MCGRINIIDNPGYFEWFKSLGIGLGDWHPPGYNVAPSAYIPVLFNAGGDLETSPMRWGVTPRWSESQLLINARSETIAEKPSFKHSFRDRRAVIPVTGFYEWKRGKTKRPFHFQPANDDLFLLAGIWEISKEGEPQCCIVTTQANGTMKPIHHRMPVMLDRGNAPTWINGNEDDASAMLKPSPDDWLSCYEVSSYVNNARNQGEECVRAI